MDTRVGTWITRLDGATTIRQRNMRYVAEPEDAGAIAYATEVIGPPSVAREFAWCGCGDSPEIDAAMLDYLRRIERSDYGDYEDIAYMLLAYMADARGWADHGTTIRCARLTEDGKEAMANLDGLVTPWRGVVGAESA